MDNVRHLRDKLRQPTPLQETERDTLMSVIERLKAADARNQSSTSPLREVSGPAKEFQEESNLPVEFFDFFEIKSA